MCKVPTPKGWTMNPEQISAISFFGKQRKPAPAGTFSKQIMNKMIKEGYLTKAGDLFVRTEKCIETVKQWLKDGEEETARRRAAAKAEENAKASAPKEDKPKGERKGREKAPADTRKIKIIAKEAPKFQAGAARADHWKMIKNGMTVSEFLQLGGIKTSLNVFEMRKLIVIK